jgi:Flp pilus assembly protein TadG
MNRFNLVRRRFQSCERGAAAVEFSIVGFVLILTVLGTIELGRGLNIRNQLSQAVDYGARRLLMDKTISNSALETSIRDAFQAGTNTQLVVTIEAETVNGVPCRTIVLNYPFNPLLPGLPGTPINFSLARRTPTA